MTSLEQSRLEDFKKVLTFHLVSKINYRLGFNGNYMLYYQAPIQWELWKAGKVKYSRPLFKYLALFNKTSLSRNQVKAIFGKDENRKVISYVDLIENDPSIKQFNKGTIVIKNKRHQLEKRYQLPLEYIKAIFDDKEVLVKVLDATSDFYTRRQRRLIFNQILKKKQKSITLNEQQKINEIIRTI